MHSRWVMMTVSFALFTAAALLAFGFSIAWQLAHCESAIVFRFLAFGSVSLVMAARLKVTENQERIKVDRAYVEFCKRNRQRILQAETEGTK